MLPPALRAETPPASGLQPWTGKAKPAFSLKRLDGQTESLANNSNRIVLVHFFATWCEPCRKEMTSLQELSARLPQDRFAIVGVDVAEVEIRVKRFFGSLLVSFPIALDHDGAVAKAWGVNSLPTTFVLGRNLTPRFYVQGDLDWNRPDIDRLLTALSNEPQSKKRSRRTSNLEKNKRTELRRDRMTLQRREFLAGAAAFAATATLPRTAHAEAVFAPKPGNWQNYEILTHLEIDSWNAPAQAWVPVPSVNEADWFKSLDNRWTTNGKAKIVRDPKYGAEFVHVEWSASEKKPVIDVTSRISTRDRAVDFSKPGNAAKLSAADRKLNTSATKLIPTDGIVKKTSDRIVKAANAKTDVEKTRAIYEWMIDNTYREASVRGCGIGDVSAMLTSGTLGGKCADLNALFVGLVRAQGIPARDVYGIRVAPSAFGYKSLGANSPTISKAQHCRAEVHLAGFGWVPMDPADVRKVILEEPPTNLPINNDKVVAARKALFGSWETNWLAYNFAHDLKLPGAKHGDVGFLMYPQAETTVGRLDSLDPDMFAYKITAKQVTA